MYDIWWFDDTYHPDTIHILNMYNALLFIIQLLKIKKKKNKYKLLCSTFCSLTYNLANAIIHRHRNFLYEFKK